MDEILCRTVFLRSFNVLVCVDSINFFIVYVISCVEYCIFSTIHRCISINIILSNSVPDEGRYFRPVILNEMLWKDCSYIVKYLSCVLVHVDIYSPSHSHPFLKQPQPVILQLLFQFHTLCPYFVLGCALEMAFFLTSHISHISHKFCTFSHSYMQYWSMLIVRLQNVNMLMQMKLIIALYCVLCRPLPAVTLNW